MSTPVTAANTQPVPQDRLYTSQAGDFGTVTVTRDSGFTGGGVAVTVTASIDGTPAAAVRTGERATLYVPAGEHIISAKAPMNTRKDRELVVKAAQIKAYRISIDNVNATLDISPTLPD
ncbi:hypothetical protein [Paraburkholderia terrae]|uniref:Uncharacterized protein n=1 Tax=Paraburkholderia terrae TaxID=311230 RepID=A0ABN6JHM8_9BURK|nr:hypothetical protein [Paraburkholderia terrae]BCZ80306.1 hypothetical protein PTKU64_39810 [Paraburkholderia terrae]BDC41229.1 hypothetical protein PTKU15_45260 [Paraburkholderia terrae]